MGDIVEDCPGLHVLAVGGNLVVVDPVEQQGERLQEHQRGHHPVDPSHHHIKIHRHQNVLNEQMYRKTCSIGSVNP